MAFKVFSLFAFVVVVVSAVEYEHSYIQHVPALEHHVVEHHEEYHDAPAHYSFEYSVHDEKTGDIKSHHESREGDSVKGSYSLIDSDGKKRIVEYTADKKSGFQATVHRVPTDIKIPQPAPKKEEHGSIHHVAEAVQHYVPIHVSSHHDFSSHSAPIVHYSKPASIKSYYSIAEAPKLSAPIKSYYSIAEAPKISYGHASSGKAHVLFQSKDVKYQY